MSQSVHAMVIKNGALKPFEALWTTLVLEGFFAVAAIAWAWFAAGRFLPAEIAGPAWATDLALGLFWGAAAAGAAWLCYRFIPRLRATKAFNAMQVLADLPVWIAIVIALSAGIGEELLFRGAIQPAWGLLPASLLFAFAHAVSPLYIAIAFIAGLGLGGLYSATGALLAPMIAHALYDALMLWMLIRGGLGPVETGTIVEGAPPASEDNCISNSSDNEQIESPDRFSA